MQLSDFHYHLPEPLIAKVPAPERTGSRLLTLDGPTGALADTQFTDLLSILNAGDLMVFNNTRVIPARVFGSKLTGGKIEMLVERVLSATRVSAHIRSSKSPRAGAVLTLLGDDGSEVQVEVVGRDGDLFVVDFPELEPVIPVLERIGHMPLPPYIDREDDAEDKERYQTVYNEHKGAVAAPTAGLHFDDAMMAAIKAKGVELAFVTLHVGAGTFQPVRVSNIQDHHMHAEYMVVNQDTCDAVKRTKANGGRVVAVGTTSVRCLETASQHGEIQPYTGDTQIFIYPGYDFKAIDALVTNFHLPESTLLMLVSAFAGYRHVMQAYGHAVAQRYRFFSYGDAMFITKNPNASEQGPR